MEEKVKIIKLNPIDFISDCFKNGIIKAEGIEPRPIKFGHIFFDKNIEPEYHIIRQSTHDGTLIFTQQLLIESIEPLLNKKTCYKLNQPTENIKDIHYTIGEIELKSEFGMKDLQCGRYPGQTDIVSIPVRTELIY